MRIRIYNIKNESATAMAQWCSCPLPMRSRTRSTPSAETSSSTCCCSSILPERRLRTPGPPQGSLTRHITPANIVTTIKGTFGQTNNLQWDTLFIWTLYFLSEKEQRRLVSWLPVCSSNVTTSGVFKKTRLSISTPKVLINCCRNVSYAQKVTKRCRLTRVTNSALVYEPKWGRPQINFGDLTPLLPMPLKYGSWKKF